MNQLITINLKSVLHNFEILSKLATQKAIAVIKADAYGHGALKIAEYIEKNSYNLEAFAVARIEEAVNLKTFGIKTDIIILSDIITEESVELIQYYGLIPVIYNESSLEIISKIKIPYILKIDTGMNRLGFKYDQIHQIKNYIDKRHVYMVMTHFSVAEIDIDFTQKQIELFDDFVSILNLSESKKTLSNSAGLINEFTINIPRIGIGMYGVNQVATSSVTLKPTMNLESEIIDIKIVKKGEVVSYGNTIIENDTKIAIVAIGYADGYNRNLSNTKAYALTHLGRISILGRVCMDLTIFDIGNLDLKIGDRVLLFGENEFGNVGIQELATYANTIAYEFFTNRTKRAKVRYID